MNKTISRRFALMSWSVFVLGLLGAAPRAANGAQVTSVRTIYLDVDLSRVPEPLHRILQDRTRHLQGKPFTSEVSEEFQKTVIDAGHQMGWTATARLNHLDGKARVVAGRAGEKPAQQLTDRPHWISSANLRVVRKVDPVYPAAAQRAGVKGTVALILQIGKDGHVSMAAAEYGPESLRQAAIDAVEQWVYQPVLQDGQSVEVVAHVSIPFPPAAGQK
jgi:TonB family protein